MQKFRFLTTQTNFSLRWFLIFLFFVLFLITSVNIVSALTSENARWTDYPHTQETKAHTYAFAILPGR
ncbi:hypothetical protein MNBD_CHLOROFLEXI01-1837 [hydrothermal vent metagenome]|uniref:Uncharacterized protein n=1 Tax=hydrothermal vent metagenome TaxID=652676 RepID=A0A3B0VGE1_9ZZZZ